VENFLVIIYAYTKRAKSALLIIILISLNELAVSVAENERVTVDLAAVL